MNTDIPIENMCCEVGRTLLDALAQIDLNAKGIVFAVDEAGRFVGTLTDGDIRRAVLARCSLDTKVTELLDKGSDVFGQVLQSVKARAPRVNLQQSAVSASVGTSLEDLVAKTSDRIKIIPLLDEDGRVADFFERTTSFHAPIAAPELLGNELDYVTECIETNWISSQGRFISIFEKQFAEHCGTAHAIAVSNGTVALHLALVALGIGPDDEVIVPDLTFAASAAVVLHAGGKPVLVDVDRESWCLDPGCVEQAITPRTKAIMPVHLYGRPCDMERLQQIAEAHELIIVEDCAEALGAQVRGAQVGSFGRTACFSFFGNKIVTTGEGGMCVTSDPALYEKMLVLRDHGMSKTRRYWHECAGFNYRMTNLQAAIGVAQMECLDSILTYRDHIAEMYHEGLADTDLVLPHPGSGMREVVWLVSGMLEESVDKDQLMSRAKEKGVDIRPFFYPLSDMPPYEGCCPRPTPVSHELSGRGISLPTSIAFSDDDYARIIDTVRECL